MTGLKDEQPALYESITKNLTPEEQQVIQGAVHQAEAIAAAAAAAHAAEQANGNGNGVQIQGSQG